ncbi:MAG: NADH-quinone oxidoreductase subunit N [Buchnera aphidicola (Kaburagia rhusicola rhusicola)]
MIITINQLISCSPLLILLSTAIVIMLFIAYNRNHFFTFLCSIIGLSFTLLSLYFVQKHVPTNVTVLFHIDKYSLFYITMIILSSMVSCVFAYSWLKNCLYDYEEFYLFLLFSTIGCISLIIANHMSVLFIGMELISLPMLGLIAYTYFKKHSLEAAVKYMILSCTVSVLALFGIALIYSISGSLTFFSVIYELLMSISHPNVVLLCGVGLVIVAFVFKLSIFPFHIWTPDVYNGTSSIVLIYLSTAAKIAVFSLFFKLFTFLTFFNVGFFNISLEIMLCCSIVFGHIMALFQTSIKRFLGYSSISQFGYLLVSVLNSSNFNFSLEVVGVYLISYWLSNVGIFGLMSIISNVNRKLEFDCISCYRSLFWYNPILSSIMTITLFSLSGIPITVGFISKFYLLSLIIKENLWFLGIIFILGSIIGIYSYLKIIMFLYLKPVTHSSVKRIILDTRSKKYVFFLFVISVWIIILGIFPDMVINLISQSEPRLFNIV